MLVDMSKDSSGATLGGPFSSRSLLAVNYSRAYCLGFSKTGGQRIFDGPEFGSVIYFIAFKLFILLMNNKCVSILSVTNKDQVVISLFFV